MVLPGFLLFAASIFAIPSALAADCFTAEPAFGFQASELQQAADQVCDYGPTAYVTLPRLYQGYKMVVMASYNGSAKIYCMVRNAISESPREEVFNAKSSKF